MALADDLKMGDYLNDSSLSSSLHSSMPGEWYAIRHSNINYSLYNKQWKPATLIGTHQESLWKFQLANRSHLPRPSLSHTNLLFMLFSLKKHFDLVEFKKKTESLHVSFYFLDLRKFKRVSD
jgi:hypothetical protein